ncbi:indoleamine 2,3-dioxygenase [Parasphingorhabdus sp. JC815]|uniref:indoleamine 2,3-dioxygenase n=1 Tax=Parasphingorhabdus sp. JC815 TaxID=3232140 RepID=UPI00345B3058
MTALDLADYDITAERGFLSSFDSAHTVLPAELHPARDLAMALPRIIVTGEARQHIEALPFIDLADFCASASLAQRRLAMVHYSFLVQAYVWGEPEPPKALPKCIALPIWQLGNAIGQPPLLTYSSYVLDNWGRIDDSGPIDLSNIYMIQPFQSGQDEAWFVLVHVAIEARAGEMLASIPALVEACKSGDTATLESGLSAMSAVWDDMNDIFGRMTDRCDPYIYFHRVRPWIHGWKDNPALEKGMIYEGVMETGGEPQAFRGQTGSQSSIVPSMDAFLGIDHAGDPLRTYLDQLHIYRPPEHRQFIDDIRANSVLRPFVTSAGSPILNELYNICVQNLTRFRTRHLEYAASYINKQSKGGAGNVSDVGTGGTPFMKYLKKHRDEAAAHML